MVEFIITGNPQREERYDYPLDAIREIVINMIIHRDYRSSSGSIIKIYDDRIEFYNPGKLFGNLTIEDLLEFKHKSQTRNKLIAKVFKSIGEIERYGSGIKRIFDICQSYGIKPPEFNDIQEGLEVILYKEKLTGGLTGGLNKLFDLIEKTPNKNTKELSHLMNIPYKTVEKWIAKLKKDNKIKYIGSKKTGGYFANHN
jgi:ATP-dependent DNA helicase RecG